MSTTQEITARAEQWLRRVTHDGESCPASMAEGEVCPQCEVNSEGAAIIRDLLADVQRRQWQPIETAPKDGTSVLLLMGGVYPSVGEWEPQKHHRNPRPYWVSERGFLFGMTWDRENQPTHWQPISEHDAC